MNFIMSPVRKVDFTEYSSLNIEQKSPKHPPKQRILDNIVKINK